MMLFLWICLLFAFALVLFSKAWCGLTVKIFTKNIYQKKLYRSPELDQRSFLDGYTDTNTPPPHTHTNSTESSCVILKMADDFSWLSQDRVDMK